MSKQIRLNNNQIFIIENCFNCPFKDSDRYCSLIEKNVIKSVVDYQVDERCFLENYKE